MTEFSLFGEEPEPEAAQKKRHPARSAPKEKKPTAKQLRMQAPSPRIVKRRDDTLDAIRMFNRFGMLSPEEKAKFSDALEPIIDPATRADLAKWRAAWS